MKYLLAIVFATVALAACGGGSSNSPAVANNTGNSGNASQPGSPAGGSGANTGNAFLALVMSIISNNSDTAEPVAVDAGPVSSPDNEEAAPIG